MGHLFGTDGIRGAAGRELTAGLAMDVAAAAAAVLAQPAGLAPGNADSPGGQGHRPFAVVGRDPRASGEFLEAAVVAGLAASGMDVVRLGVMPTPGVAHLTSDTGAGFGVMLSASHNPAPDNGIKIFARGGVKLPDAVEFEIEARLAELSRSSAGDHGPVGVPPDGFGRVTDAADASERYLDHLLSTLGAGAGNAAAPLAGLRVVVDCANGAAARF